MRTEIISRAPTRIDLAGGTLDIWPIYLLLKQAETVNLAIDLFAETRVEFDPDGPSGVILRSDDQGKDLVLDWKSLESSEDAPSQLELHFKFLRHFARGSNRARGTLRVSTKALSPAGAGLGGSSALSISLIGALSTWATGNTMGEIGLDGTDATREHWIEIARDVETTVIRVPAGLQDYYGAAYGGLQKLSWRTARHARLGYAREMITELESRILLFYSGQSRNSGINNWQLTKNFIDVHGPVRSQFEGILAATHQLATAIDRRDWKGVGAAIASEWEFRRSLAPGITTPEIDQAFAIARAEGAAAGKICGAGGGGCFFVYVDSGDYATRMRITEKISALQGIRPLPFKGSPGGVTVQVTRA